MAKQIRTDWRLIAVETTEYYNPDAQEQYGRVYDVYLVDARALTYCCSLTPSYACYYINSMGEYELSDEEQTEFIRGAAPDQMVVYYDHIQNFKAKILTNHNTEIAAGDRDAYDDEVEAMIEFTRANSIIDPFAEEPNK